MAKERILYDTNDYTDDYELMYDDLMFLRRTADKTVLVESCVAIARLGLWNGTVWGYSLRRSLSDCFKVENDCAIFKWYIDGRNNLRSSQTHHDGTHNILYRMWKPNISDSSRQTFLNKITNQTVTSNDISRYTVSLGKYFVKE